MKYETIVDKNISEIIELLRKEKPDVGIALTHSTPLEHALPVGIYFRVRYAI